MIIAGMVAYYLFAFALLAAVAYHAVRQNVRDADALYDQMKADLKRYADTPPMPPPLPPPAVTDDAEWDDEDEWDDADEEFADLSPEQLGPIAPLLRRVAQEYRDNPADRERLVNSLAAVLNATAPAG